MEHDSISYIHLAYLGAVALEGAAGAAVDDDVRAEGLDGFDSGECGGFASDEAGAVLCAVDDDVECVVLCQPVAVELAREGSEGVVDFLYAEVLDEGLRLSLHGDDIAYFHVGCLVVLGYEL